MVNLVQSIVQGVKRKKKSIEDVSGTIHLNPTKEEREKIQAELDLTKPEPRKKGILESAGSEVERIESKTLIGSVGQIVTGQANLTPEQQRASDIVRGGAIATGLAVGSGFGLIELAKAMAITATTKAVIAAKVKILISKGFTKKIATEIVAGQKISTISQIGLKLGAPATKAAAYAATAKSTALTAKWLALGGFSLGATGLAKDVLGTYPFAGFIKEEALQTAGFPIKAALDGGDVNGAQLALDQSNEILTMDTTKIPYLNVQQNLQAYFSAQATANAQWQRLIDEAVLEKETGGTGQFESPFEESARESEERSAKIARDIEARDIRQAKLDEEETARFAQIEIDKAAEDVEDNLFFSSLEKAKLGLELAPEEIAALNERGYTDELILALKEKVESFKGGSSGKRRSALDFGLLK